MPITVSQLPQIVLKRLFTPFKTFDMQQDYIDDDYIGDRYVMTPGTKSANFDWSQVQLE